MRLLTTIRHVPGKLRRLWASSALKGAHAAENPGLPASDIPIEVLIPVVAKDAGTVPLCIESIRRFVRHPISRIRLVSPPDERIDALGVKLDIAVVDENQLLSAEARQLDYRINGADRSGWVKQQLLKLSGDALVETSRFLVVDADTAFVRNVVFCRDGRDVLFCSDEYNRSYYTAYRRLTGIASRYPLSFVSHHMLFNVEHLRELRATIERFTGKRWDLAIIGLLDPQVLSCFSEYEMYGNFCVWTRSNAIEVRYWHNRSEAARPIPQLSEAVRAYGGQYNTVSYHTYLAPRANQTG